MLFLGNDLKNDLYKGKENSLLDGLVGVALVLLTYYSEKRQSWPSLLFL
jgi:hypothetical protein